MGADHDRASAPAGSPEPTIWIGAYSCSDELKALHGGAVVAPVPVPEVTVPDVVPVAAGAVSSEAVPESPTPEHASSSPQSNIEPPVHRTSAT